MNKGKINQLEVKTINIVLSVQETKNNFIQLKIFRDRNKLRRKLMLKLEINLKKFKNKKF